MNNKALEFATLAIHGGEQEHAPGQSVALDMCLSTSFHVDASIGFSAGDFGEEPPLFYTRWANPTIRSLERRLALLDGAEDGLCFSSGMAAISALLFSLLSAGDHLIVSDVCYAGSAELFHELVERRGIAVSFVDTSNETGVLEALRPSTRLVFIETPANPILRLADIAAIARVAREAGVWLAVDSTIATPVGTRPIALGADFVVHSLTKYIGGHGDSLGGAILGARASLAHIRRDSLVHLGGAMHPFAAWLIERGVQTLEVRMNQHAASAALIAQFLEAHPAVDKVYYPGSPSHPQHALAQRQMKNFSGMVSFTAKDPLRIRDRLIERLDVVSYAISLGKTKSVIFYIATDQIQRSSFRLGDTAFEDYRAAAGDGVFRLSVGLEAAADIIGDLQRALD
jgi:cystathionine gamma-synthase/methionine-gamma-lyase